MCPTLPRSTLFPYTTLFRSRFRRTRRGATRPQKCVHDVDIMWVAVRIQHPRSLFRQRWASVRPLARLGLDDECRSEEHTSELQSLRHLVCRLLLEKKKKKCK